MIWLVLASVCLMSVVDMYIITLMWYLGDLAGVGQCMSDVSGRHVHYYTDVVPR